MLSSSSPPFFWRRRETAVWARTTARQLDASSMQPATLLQPPAAARLSWQQPGPGPCRGWGGTPSSSLICWQRPSNCTHFFLRCAHQLVVSGSGFSWKVFWKLVIRVPPYTGIRSYMWTAVPRHARLCLLASEYQLFLTFETLVLLGEVTSQSLFLKSSTAWVIPTSSLRADLPLATTSSYQGMLNFQCGVACEMSPLAWSMGPVVLAHGFHAGAVLKSIVFAWSVFPSDYSYVWLSVSIVPVLVSAWMLLSGTLFLFHWQKCWILARLRATPVESHQKYFHLIEIPHWCLLLALWFSQFLIHLIYAWIKLCSAVF